MFSLLCFLLIPMIAFVIAGRLRRDSRSVVFDVARYLLLMLAILVVNGIVMIPLDRAAMRIAWNGKGGAFLYIDYGTVSALSACLLSFAMGVLLRIAHKKQSLYSVVESKRGAAVSVRGAVLHLLVLILLWLTLSLSWGLSRFGNVGFEEIVFHLNVPLEGSTTDLVVDYLKTVSCEVALSFALFEALVFFPSAKRYQIRNRKDRVLLQVLPFRMSFGCALAGLAAWMLLLLVGADANLGFTEYVIAQIRQSELIEKEYVDPEKVSIVFPEEKRNLITIYVESAETSSQDKANGGFFDVNYIPEMTRIARENTSFSHSNLIEGAAVAPACGWTIAGLSAETAGLPLKLYTEERGKWGKDNQMDKFSSFMPGATTLGDILKDAGYRNIFMCGSDLTFGGRRTYFTQHGDYEAYDYVRAQEEGRIARDYYVNWGFEDEKLYAWAKEVLTEASASSQPFNFSMLTVDTHNPDGYVCRLCRSEHEHMFANVLSCASRQLDDFLAWCKEQPFYENTSIIVLGDHASMTVGFYEEEMVDTHLGNQYRKIYNAFINCPVEPVREENRRFTTIDFYPTTLAAIGAQIEGDRLALGTNLFSDRDTLAEEYGYDVLFEELHLKSQFYNEEIMYPD